MQQLIFRVVFHGNTTLFPHACARHVLASGRSILSNMVHLCLSFERVAD